MTFEHFCQLIIAALAGGLTGAAVGGLIRDAVSPRRGGYQPKGPKGKGPPKPPSGGSAGSKR